MHPIITLETVSKIFRTGEREFAALRNVNLGIEKGAFIAVTGRSGSGKSTLLNMITGIDHPTSGRVCVAGTHLGPMNESRLARWRGRTVGIVFQFFQLIPTLTIRENILLAMEFVGAVPAGERERRTRSLLETVGIERHADKLPSALSGGEHQRAAIARALANDPPLLVADEPTGNLDSATAGIVHALLAKQARAGKTVVVVTHAPVQGGGYDRIIRLEDGEILDDIPQTVQEARQ